MIPLTDLSKGEYAHVEIDEDEDEDELSLAPLPITITPRKKRYWIVFWIMMVVLFLSFLIVILSIPSSAMDDPSAPKHPLEPSGNTSMQKTNKTGLFHRPLIFMLSDGMGPASMTMARQVSRRNPLNVDSALVGTVQTYSTSSLVTDSAAGGTAYATGVKSFNGAIAVDDQNRPLGTVLEAARDKGWPVGMVVTSRITHATPASFSAHALHRDYEEFIAEQQAVAGIDVLFGGGRDSFMVRNDSRLLLDEMKELQGYRVLDNATHLREIAKGVDDGTQDPSALPPLVGLFADDHMSFEVDRDPVVQPALQEMVDLALKILAAKAEQRGTPFFLLIEGSRIDMAAHNNDASTQVPEVIAFDDAFGVVRAFVNAVPAGRAAPLVVSSSDHETGGLSLGMRPDDLHIYPIYEWHADVLQNPTVSTEVVSAKIMDAMTSEERRALARLYMGALVTPEQLDRFDDLAVRGEGSILMYELGLAKSHDANVAWATIGHSGVDVNLYTLGDDDGLPTEAILEVPTLAAALGEHRRLRGNIQNAAIGLYMQAAMGLYADTQKITTKLVNEFDPSQDGKYHRVEV